MKQFKPIFYLTLVIIALIAVNFVQHKRIKNKDATIVRIENNLKAVTVQYTTELGILATQSQAVQVELTDLRYVNRLADSLLSYSEVRLKKANKIIKDQEKKLKNIESINLLTMEAKGSDTVYYEVSKIDTFYNIDIPDFNDGYLNFHMEFLDNLTLARDYDYKDEINLIVTREKDLKDERFFLWRLFNPKFQYYSTATTGNKKAEITVNDFIMVK